MTKATPRPYSPHFGKNRITIQGDDCTTVAVLYDSEDTDIEFREEAEAAATLFCAAVNAWDDPVALRARIRELETNG